MNDREISQQERFGRVTAFADNAEFQADFPAGKPSGENVAIVRDVMNQLFTLAGTQSGSGSAARQATRRKSALLAEVRADLVGLSETARALEDEKPDLQSQFKLPPNARDDALLASARAQLAILTAPTTGAALVELFVDYGMRADFVADLQADITAADEANAQQDTHGGDRRGDTLAIDTQIERGIKAVAKLDAYCANKYRDDAAKLGRWKSASHLELRRVHPRKTPVP